ncbi:hypothetical protein [Pseudomonas brassicacearum]|uniref:hypothetical protein n=1 Tax=Pseudomonas brassicacearum TaxID=930166 RepID=UPI001297D29C
MPAGPRPPSPGARPTRADRQRSNGQKSSIKKPAISTSDRGLRESRYSRRIITKWRQLSTHLFVLVTDSDPHHARDGDLAGILSVGPDSCARQKR